MPSPITKGALAALAGGLVLALAPSGAALAEEEPSESPSPSEAPAESPSPSEAPEESPSAEPSETTAPAPTRGFTGYISEAWAAPVKIELYEPTIPIPASPQGEVEVAYTEVEGDSSQSRGRSSYLWPGDPIGEGFKTFVEQLGFPPELGEDGYPVQVNSLYPAGPDYAADEPFPGFIQRAGSAEGSAYAENGYSSDNEAQDRDDTSDEGDDGGLVPGLPLPGLDDLLSGEEDGEDGAGEDAGDESGLGLPPELGAVIDLGGFTSRSKLATLTEATATARSAFGDLAILDGLIRLEGVKVRAQVSSDGTSSEATGVSAYGEMVVLGQRFAFGPEGFVAAGQPTPIPGLPDDPGEALKELGITLKFPKPVYERSADQASASVSGLVVEIDLGPLQKALRTLPLADLLNALPEQAGELKNALGALANLSSRLVLTLGNARASVDTTPPLPPPTAEPSASPSASASPADNNGGGTGGTATGGGGAPVTTPGSTAPPTGTTATPPADLDAAPTSAGLPPLFSIPGLLLVGGIAAATVIGSHLRRLGAAALGGGAPCPHGLDSGLPDLRKA